jgi:hypothetical protein
MKGLFAVLVCVVALGAGCLNKQLNPGRCNSTADCQSGQTCDLSPQANGTCVCNSPACTDGGAGMGGAGGGAGTGTGGAAGSGGMAGAGQGGGSGGCQSNLQCSPPMPACAPGGVCVECTASSDCADPTKPICNANTNKCEACTTDQQCIDKIGSSDPGVCMAQADGHCATPGEAIYVKNDVATCVGTTVPNCDVGSGTVAKPLCSMELVSKLLCSGRDLVIIRGTVTGASSPVMGRPSGQTAIVGQQSALLGSVGTPAFAMSTGSFFVRDLRISSSGSDGIDESGGTLTLQNVTIAGSATSGVGISTTAGTLNLSGVTIDSCAGGGILLGGAAFDIENTTVTNNGPSSDLSWGGIRVQSMPASGSALLHLVTIENNKAAGLSCASGATVQGDGVFASGNSAGQIASTCGVTACTPMSATCGAQ